MFGLVKDVFDGKIASTTLHRKIAVAADTGSYGTAVEVVSQPQAVGVKLIPVKCAASHGATVKVFGSDDDGVDDAYVELAAFTAFDDDPLTPQLKNIATPKKFYKAHQVITGAFGGGAENVIFVVELVGTNVRFAPITQS